MRIIYINRRARLAIIAQIFAIALLLEITFSIINVFLLAYYIFKDDIYFLMAVIINVWRTTIYIFSDYAFVATISYSMFHGVYLLLVWMLVFIDYWLIDVLIVYIIGQTHITNLIRRAVYGL